MYYVMLIVILSTKENQWHIKCTSQNYGKVLGEERERERERERELEIQWGHFFYEDESVAGSL